MSTPRINETRFTSYSTRMLFARARSRKLPARVLITLPYQMIDHEGISAGQTNILPYQMFVHEEFSVDRKTCCHSRGRCGGGGEGGDDSGGECRGEHNDRTRAQGTIVQPAC